MNFGVHKSVAGAAILFILITCAFVSLFQTEENLYSHDLIEKPDVATPESSEIPKKVFSLARLGRDFLRAKKKRPVEETLKIDETEDIWLRRSPELHAALKQEVSVEGILVVAI
jgi:hypothetical protein